MLRFMSIYGTPMQASNILDFCLCLWPSQKSDNSDSHFLLDVILVWVLLLIVKLLFEFLHVFISHDIGKLILYWLRGSGERKVVFLFVYDGMEKVKGRKSICFTYPCNKPNTTAIRKSWEEIGLFTFLCLFILHFPSLRLIKHTEFFIVGHSIFKIWDFW